MSHDTQINNLIAQNEWVALETFLKNEHGFIGKLGGRYFCSAFSEIDGYSSINQICWSIFTAMICMKRFMQHVNLLI